MPVPEVTTYVERYVTPTGAGSNTGLDWANAFTLAQALADITQGKRYNLSGTFSPTATTTITSPGAVTSPVAWRGWNASQTAVATTFAERPTIDFVGLASGDGWYHQTDYHVFSWINFINAPARNFRADNAGWDNNHFYKCSFDNAGTDGLILSGQYQSVVCCEATGNGGYGFNIASYSDIVAFCSSYNNETGSAFQQCCVVACYLGEAANAAYGNLSSNLGPSIVLCTIDGTAGGAGSDVVNMNGNFGMFIANQITNAVDYGFVGTGDPQVCLLNNYYGNTTGDAIAAINTFISEGETTNDPDYTAIATRDYTGGSSAVAINPLPVLGDWFQGAGHSDGGGGGGGGGGLLIHPGMAGGLRG